VRAPSKSVFELAVPIGVAALSAALLGLILAGVIAGLLSLFKRPNMLGARGVRPLSCAIAFVAGMTLAVVV
jgi:hypothetical protein